MSPRIFQVSQVLDMAIKAEEQGRKFYQACRHSVMEDEAAELFDFLIKQEEKHAHQFLEMKKRAEQFNLPESYSGEAQSYANSFVAGRIFEDPEAAASKIKGPEGRLEVIRLALNYEDKSVHFYEDLKDWIRLSEREILEQIIQEEKKHMKRLNDLRQKMEADQGTESWA